MAFNRGPKIVTNGLVLALDAASRNSYPGSGTTWTDLSGNNNNGTLVNSPTFDSGNGGSIAFNGSTNYVSGSLSTINTWTMSVWYLSKNISSALVYYPFSGAALTGLGFGGTFDANTQNKWFFFDGTNIFSNSNTSVVINTWYNLVVTKTSTSYNLYTNGNLSISGTGLDLSYSQYVLGARADGVWYVNGNVAQASMYNRVLSATEIAQNYNATKSRFNL
jgi:hypothetical protein